MIKRGQITLFVILGIVILGVIAFALFFRAQFSKTEVNKEAAELSSLPPDLQGLRDDVSECALTIADEALYTVGQQGGYFLTPSDAIPNGEYSVSLGVKNNIKVLADENTFKREIASYLEAYLPQCVDFAAFDTFEIFDQPPVTRINLNDENTDLTITYKITAQKDDNTYNIFDPYEVNLPYRVKKVYESSSKIADDIASNPEEFDVAKILSYGLDVDVYTLENNHLILSVKDKKSSEENNYEFDFGVSL